MNLEQTTPPIALGLAALANIDPIALLTVAGPVLVALATGWFAFRKGQAELGQKAQDSMQDGFKVLIKELQSENVKLIDRLERQSVKMDEQTQRMGDMEDEMRQMSRHIARLEKALLTAGLDLPATPNR